MDRTFLFVDENGKVSEMRMEGETMNTVTDLNPNKKEGAAAVQISKQNLKGHSYKDWMESLGKAKRSDPSIQRKRKICRVTGHKGSEEEDDTADSGSPVCNKRRKRQNVGRVKRVKNSTNAEKSNTTRTKLQKKRNHVTLQENFTQSSENSDKYSTTKFVEYWVPVRLSNVQTELYCGSLFSNSGVLCSSSKQYDKETLENILLSIRKCCDHPNLVDSSYRESLIREIPQHEQLETEIKLSSKLLLLHKILQETSKRGLRVVILYQTLESHEPNSTGYILDDMIHQNFGEDSYVWIDGALSMLRKRAVVNSYNSKESDKLICLLPTKACIPSIRLHSIDTVIFFNSDWDPMNDLRALQKILLRSQLEHVKVFRLYSAHTVEEKLLMLAKQSTSPGRKLPNIRRSTYHELLTWGANYLFTKLDDFHGLTSDGNPLVTSDAVSFVEDVFLELSNLLPNSKEISVQTESSHIVKVQQIGGLYPRNVCLLGEVEYPLLNKEMMLKEPAYVLWKNLLQGRKPSWKYFSSHSPRNRKCVQRFDDLHEAPVRASKNCRAEARKKSVNKLVSRDKKSLLPGEAAAPTKRQAPMLDNPSPTEPCSRDEQDPQTAGTSDSRTNVSPSETPQLTQSQVPQSVNEFQRELERLQKKRTEILKQHKDKKLQLNMARIKEIDEINKKYEVLLLDADMAFVEKRQILDTSYDKVLADKSLAEAMLQRTNSEHADLPQAGQHMSGSSTNLMSSHQLSQASPSLHLSTSPPKPSTNLMSSHLLSLASLSLHLSTSPPNPNTNLMSSHQLSQASPSLHLSTRPPNPMYNPRITFSGNNPPSYQMAAPAPHHRHMVPPQASRPLLALSHRPNISYSPVSLQPVAQSRK